jgi:hypothetical protein
VRNPEGWSGVFGWTNTSPLWILAGVIFYLGIPLLCFAAAGGIESLYRRNRAGLLLVLTSIIPVAAVMTISTFQYAANRYALVSLVGCVVLAATASVALVRTSWQHGRILVIGALATLVLAPVVEDGLYYQYQNGNRDDWKDAFAFVERNLRAGDMVVVPDRRVGNYYLPVDTQGMALLTSDALKGSKSRIWFVEDLNVVQKWPWIHTWVQENAQIMADYDVHVAARNFEMNVYLYDPGP